MKSSLKTQPQPAANSPTSPPLDLEAANTYLESRAVAERIGWALEVFGSGLYALTSAGVDSALLLEHIAQAGYAIPIIFINTGFLPNETLVFRDQLQRRYRLQLHEFGPSLQRTQEIAAARLWESDLALYSKLTKLGPMSEAIQSLGVKAILTAVRGDQTQNRATMGYIGPGNDGELRIRPFIDWPKAKVSHYFDEHDLPRHPLYHQGYESVGDWHTTVVGKNREGRTVMECGLHVDGGHVVTNS